MGTVPNEAFASAWTVLTFRDIAMLSQMAKWLRIVRCRFCIFHLRLLLKEHLIPGEVPDEA